MKNKQKFWTTSDEKRFFPQEGVTTIKKLKPGLYDSGWSGPQIYLELLNFNNPELINLPNSNTSVVLEDIEKFWTKKDLFKQYSFPYKRGILLYGEAGCGKTSAISLISKKVIDLGGIVLIFRTLELFGYVIEIIKNLEGNIPIVVLMEDIDHILKIENVSEILNLLDGIGEGCENIVYLATTNKIECLQSNIKNRPSRFDRKIYFGPPDEKIRKEYLKYLASFGDIKINIAHWAKKTKGFAFAHLKELFVSVALFDNDFKEVIKELQDMNIEAKPSFINDEEDDEYYDEYE